MHNTALMELASYFRYWGKAKKPLEIDYCEGQMSDEAIVAKYDRVNSISHLKTLADNNGWHKVAMGESFAHYHLLVFHSLDVAAEAAQQQCPTPVGVNR